VDEILDEIGDFGRTKNDILDNIFLLSLPSGIDNYVDARSVVSEFFTE